MEVYKCVHVGRKTLCSVAVLMFPLAEAIGKGASGVEERPDPWQDLRQDQAGRQG